MPSYVLLRRDRSRHGGGVLIFVRESLCVLSCERHERAELLSIVVNAGSGPLWLGVIYRPPGLDHSLEDLESVLVSLDLASHKKVVLLGDFNVDLLLQDDL